MLDHWRNGSTVYYLDDDIIDIITVGLKSSYGNQNGILIERLKIRRGKGWIGREGRTNKNDISENGRKRERERGEESLASSCYRWLSDDYPMTQECATWWGAYHDSARSSAQCGRRLNRRSPLLAFRSVHPSGTFASFPSSASRRSIYLSLVRRRLRCSIYLAAESSVSRPHPTFFRRRSRAFLHRHGDVTSKRAVRCTIARFFAIAIDERQKVAAARYPSDRGIVWRAYITRAPFLAPCRGWFKYLYAVRVIRLRNASIILVSLPRARADSDLNSSGYLIIRLIIVISLFTSTSVIYLPYL